MANLNIQIESSKSLMQIAHNALKKATQPKQKISVEDFTIGFDSVMVSYYDQNENWNDEVLSMMHILNFINNHYSDVFDYEVNGEHQQYTDVHTALEYFNDNPNTVLTDFLNNRR